jgi:hypothetical protein
MHSALASALTTTRPPAGVNLMALENRFSSTCQIVRSLAKLQVRWFPRVGRCKEVEDVTPIHRSESFLYLPAAEWRHKLKA